jgi:hypothetical protein
MNSKHTIYNESLESLQEKAIVDIEHCRDGLKMWAGSVRAEDGPGGRFNWAVKYNDDMPANITSTSYSLQAFDRAGIVDELVSEQDKKECIAWLEAMKQPGGNYVDPVYDKMPEEPSDGYSDGNFHRVINYYTEEILQIYGADAKEIEEVSPPPSWPQLETADTAADWIAKRTWEYDTWRSGDISASVIYFLYQWYLAGKIDLKPLADAVKVVYDLQDKQTGLWTNRSKSNCSLQNRINGTFKLMMVISKDLDLPIFHAEKIVDTMIDHMTSETYVGSRSGCDELDNILTLAVGSRSCDGYRYDEVQKIAAWQISLMKELYHRSDGGLSFYPDYGQHNWVGFEITPITLQGDAMGAAVHSLAFSIAIELAGIEEKVKWQNKWHQTWQKNRIDGAEQKLKKLSDTLTDILI